MVSNGTTASEHQDGHTAIRGRHHAVAPSTWTRHSTIARPPLPTTSRNSAMWVRRMLQLWDGNGPTSYQQPMPNRSPTAAIGSMMVSNCGRITQTPDDIHSTILIPTSAGSICSTQRPPVLQFIWVKHN